MKKIFTYLLFAFSLMAWPVQAQEIDESYVFTDAEGNVIENGSTVIRNVVEPFDGETECIKANIFVKNMTGSTQNVGMIYVIERIDNGAYQICFPSSCNTQSEVGTYTTASSTLMGDVQDIQSEWLPVADGECIVTLTMELFAKVGFFPPTYIHTAYGPTITVRFVKGEIPPEPGIPGDVNGDNEVNIADVNAVIDMILSTPDPSGDVNGDNEVNIADVNAVIDLILS